MVGGRAANKRFTGLLIHHESHRRTARHPTPKRNEHGRLDGLAAEPARWALPLARADGPHAFEIVRAGEGVRLLL